MTRLGRALGPGRLTLVQRGAGRPTWTLRWTDATGRRRCQALSTDKRVAQLRANEIIRQRDMAVCGLAAVDGMNTPLVDIRDAYLADLATRATPAHVANSKAALTRLLGELRAVRVRDLRPIEVLQARARLLQEGLAPRTANVHCDRLRALLAWAVEVGLIAENPLARLRRLPDGEAHARYKRRALSDDEIRRFLGAAEADDRENGHRVVEEASKHSRRTLRHRGARVPQRPFWAFLIETGCRYGEARALTWGDVDLDGLVVTLRAETTKARRARRVPIRAAFGDELARLRELHQGAPGRDPEPSGRVFLSPEGRPLPVPTVNAMRVFDRLLVAAGIERVDAHGRKLDIHALRGTCASVLARRGIGLAITQRLLGHSDPKLTTRHYVDLGVDDLRDAVEAAAADGAARGPRLVRGDDAAREGAAADTSRDRRGAGA